MTSKPKGAQTENLRLRQLQRRADEVARLILNTDLPWVDIAIQIERLREETRRLFPGKDALFDLIYVHRFERLWDQWRPGEQRG